MAESTASGVMHLDQNLAPGEYVLQVVVRDENDNSKITTQAIDYKVIP